ncbi:hypothetical protein [Thaumasiovibrio sp. DFM-14]
MSVKRRFHARNIALRLTHTQRVRQKYNAPLYHQQQKGLSPCQWTHYKQS